MSFGENCDKSNKHLKMMTRMMSLSTVLNCDVLEIDLLRRGDDFS